MIVNKSRQAVAISLALSLAGCEFIGPQIHTKLPLPELPPSIDEALVAPQVINPEDSKKTTKVEMFPSEDSALYPSVQSATLENAAGKGEYSLNFDDADLGEVAKVILSDILGKNYTLSPEVTGKVTLQTTKPLARAELLPTLDMLLSMNNAAIVLQNGLYVIKPSADAVYGTTFKSFGSSSTMPGGYQVRVIPVKNVAANEIGDILKPLLPEKALLNVDPKRNILMVAGTSAELNRIIDLVATFDIDVLKGRSFALFTPAHVDAGVIIEELEQIFNNAPASGGSGAGKKDKEASPSSTPTAGDGGFFRFIEIDRLNAILAITHKQHFLRDIETWVLRLDKTNSEGKGGVNVYKAQHHSAADLAQTLSNIFGTGGGQNSRGASIASGRRALSASNRSGSGSSGTGGAGTSSSNMNTGGFGNNNSSSNNSFGGNNQNSNSGFGGSNGSVFGGNSSTTGSTGNTGNSGSGGGQALMPNVKIIADENNNALVIVANAQEYSTILKVLKQLDVLPLQVMIDATIVEVTLKDDLSYGIEWYFTHYNGGTNTIAGGAKGSTINGLQTISGISTGGLSYLFTNPSQNIGALLQAQATNNNINVISSPSLMVLNNQEATIKVGDSVPILSSTSTFTTGVATSNSIQMVDTGVNLAIRPRVNANGLVLMDLMQSVNAAVATTATSSINSPTIQKREIQTNVAVQSGETIVLGGLIREENDYNRNGVPWLHELPYIGSLFGGTTRNKDKTELVILLTPRVMKSRQDAQDVTEEFKRKLTGIYEDKVNVDVEVLPEEAGK